MNVSGDRAATRRNTSGAFHAGLLRAHYQAACLAHRARAADQRHIGQSGCFNDRAPNTVSNSLRHLPGLCRPLPFRLPDGWCVAAGSNGFECVVVEVGAGDHSLFAEVHTVGVGVVDPAGVAFNDACPVEDAGAGSGRVLVDDRVQLQ